MDHSLNSAIAAEGLTGGDGIILTGILLISLKTSALVT
jgi:hypothetical protein